MTREALDRLRSQMYIDAREMRGLPAPAKLNLFLHVIGRREDGYHLLQTVFRLVDLSDTIDVSLRDDGAVVRSVGLDEVPPDEDLVVRAARTLQAATGIRAGATIGVRKRIPTGGGLGGGSSDAATVLLALNRLWKLGLTRMQLQEIGLALGADVPVFVFGRNASAEGVGEQLEPLLLTPARYLIVHPGIGVPTAAIFGDPGLTRNTPVAKIMSFSEWGYPPEGATNGGVSGVVAGTWHNDLEPVARRRFPAVATALEWLAARPGACGPARMSGSGSCCFVRVDGAFVGVPAPAGMASWLAESLEKHPLFDVLAC